jgi:hypothetical protein
VAVQAGPELAAVGGGVGQVDLRPRQHDQRHPGPGEFVAKAADMGQDVGAQQVYVAVAVRRGDDVRDAVLDAEPRHGERLLQGGGPVVDARQEVAVEIEHCVLPLRWPVV